LSTHPATGSRKEDNTLGRKEKEEKNWLIFRIFHNPVFTAETKFHQISHKMFTVWRMGWDRRGTQHSHERRNSFGTKT
jgi:hypothetical protein